MYRPGPCCLPHRLTASASRISDFAAQYLTCRFPLSTLQRHPRERLRMTRDRNDLLNLFRVDFHQLSPASFGWRTKRPINPSSEAPQWAPQWSYGRQHRQVSVEKMSESEPTDDASSRIQSAASRHRLAVVSSGIRGSLPKQETLLGICITGVLRWELGQENSPRSILLPCRDTARFTPVLKLLAHNSQYVAGFC